MDEFQWMKKFPSSRIRTSDLEITLKAVLTTVSRSTNWAIEGVRNFFDNRWVGVSSVRKISISNNGVCFALPDRDLAVGTDSTLRIDGAPACCSSALNFNRRSMKWNDGLVWFGLFIWRAQPPKGYDAQKSPRGLILDSDLKCRRYRRERIMLIVLLQLVLLIDGEFDNKSILL